MPNYHVTKRPTGWASTRAGGQKATKIVETQKKAIEIAKQIVENQGGGEVIVHGVRGKIVNKDTVKPAKDPFPPKG